MTRRKARNNVHWHSPLRISWPLWVISSASIFFLLAPILLIVIMSFGPANIIVFPPTKFGLDQYHKFFTHPAWINAVLTSLQVALLTTTASTTLGLMASIALVWGKFKAKGFITGFILSPMIVPLIILGLAYYIFLAKLGLVGTKLGLIIAYIPLTLPFTVIPISAALQSFDRSLENAALSLGATRFQAFRKIIFPLIRPGVLTGAIFAFMVAFDEVVIAIFISGSTAVTLPKKMWDTIRYQIEPMLPAISTLLLLLEIFFLVSVMLLQRNRAKRMNTR